jgi:hypothetical protein
VTPLDLAATIVRRQELFFASQSRWMLEACRARLTEDGERQPRAKAGVSDPGKRNLALLSYSARCELGNTLYDFSQVALDRRWRAGGLLANAFLAAPRRSGVVQWRWDGDQAVRAAG